MVTLQSLNLAMDTNHLIWWYLMTNYEYIYISIKTNINLIYIYIIFTYIYTYYFACISHNKLATYLHPNPPSPPRHRPGYLRAHAAGVPAVRLFGRPAPDVLPRQGERLEGTAQANLVLTRQMRWGEPPFLIGLI
jgi:hypothetical protein